MPFSDDTLRVFDIIDDVFVFIFCAEAVTKIIGMGIVEYFNDNWNRFDFILVVLSLILNVTMSVLRISKNLISSRGLKFLRLSKSQRGLKMVKWMKKSRLVSWIFSVINTLTRIKAIILKSVM